MLVSRVGPPHTIPRASAAGAEADSYPLGSPHQFGLYDDPLGVVGESAGLQGDDAFAWNGLGDRPVPGVDDDVPEDPVGVACAVGVGQDHLVPLHQLVQIVEHEVAVRAGVAQAVAGYVDVGSLLPGEARAPQVHSAGLERGLVASRGIVDV